MKCPICHNEKIIFLGMWYDEIGDLYVLKTHYGCETCRVMITRPVSEDGFYYMKADGTVIMRATPDPAETERRIRLIEIDPGFYVRK